jgi:hypothetical protein
MQHSLDKAMFVHPGRWFGACRRLYRGGDPMGTGTQHVDRLLPEQQARRIISVVARRLVEARCLQSPSLTTPKGVMTNMTFRFAVLSLALVSISHPALASVDASAIDADGVAIDALLDSSGAATADAPLASVDAVAPQIDVAVDLALATPDARATSAIDAGNAVDLSPSVDAGVGKDASVALDGGSRALDGGAVDAGPKPILLVDGGAQGLVPDDRGCSIGAVGRRHDLGLGFGALPFLAWAVIRTLRRRGSS